MKKEEKKLEEKARDTSYKVSGHWWKQFEYQVDLSFKLSFAFNFTNKTTS